MSRARQHADQVDLFLWEQISEARAEVERTETDRNTAARRVLCAPVGTKKARLSAYLEATNRALRAATELRRLEREARQ